MRDELCHIYGLIVKGQRIIIPTEMRREMLNIIHNGHFGVDKCMRRARDTMY